MKVYMHLPDTQEGKSALQDKINEFHAKGIVSYIKKLECSENTKAMLFEHLKDKAKELSE